MQTLKGGTSLAYYYPKNFVTHGLLEETVMMARLAMIIVAPMVIVACGDFGRLQKKQNSDSAVKTAEERTVDLKCARKSENKGAQISESVQLLIEGKQVLVAYEFESKQGSKATAGKQEIETEINSVFDFNVVRDDRVFIVTNSGNLLTKMDNKNSSKDYGSLIIEVNDGKLNIRQASGENKVVLEMENCKAASEIKPIHKEIY
jgi:hypothetical protein